MCSHAHHRNLGRVCVEFLATAAFSQGLRYELAMRRLDRCLAGDATLLVVVAAVVAVVAIVVAVVA